MDAGVSLGQYLVDRLAQVDITFDEVALCPQSP